MKYKLRPYQEEAKNAALWHISHREKPGIVVAATGAGKSLIIAAICHELNDNIIVLQPNRELVLQNYEKFTSYAPELEAGIYSASAGAKDIRKVTFATIGSIYKKPELFRHFNYAILDECHGLNPKQLGSTMLGKFLKGAEIGNVIGLTATPYRVETVYTWENGQLNGSAGLKMLNRIGKNSFFGNICYKIEHKELEQMGYLVPIKYYQDNVSWDDLKANSTGANFTDESQKVFGGRIITRAIQAIQYAEKHHKRCLVFCQTVGQAETIQEHLADMGITVGLVTAKTPDEERKQLVADFKSGKLKTMLNMGVFTTGFDVPELDCIVMSRATMSLALWYQMIGRGVRLDPSDPNKVLHVYDIANVTEKLGRVETIRIQKEAGGFRDEVWSEKGRLDNKIMYTYTINRKGSDAKEKPKSKPKYQKLVPQVGTFMRK
nr:MAG TPA: DNA helicase [Podoviridae sp. ctK5Q1]